jgi:hypothetical protein
MDPIFTLFDKYGNKISTLRDENKVCLIKCTDKLNSPSEELTCYEKCEQVYLNKLIDFKENLFNDFNKII